MTFNQSKKKDIHLDAVNSHREWLPTNQRSEDIQLDAEISQWMIFNKSEISGHPLDSDKSQWRIFYLSEVRRHPIDADNSRWMVLTNQKSEDIYCMQMNLSEWFKPTRDQKTSIGCWLISQPIRGQKTFIRCWLISLWITFTGQRSQDIH